jgi:hypothetical protein
MLKAHHLHPAPTGCPFESGCTVLLLHSRTQLIVHFTLLHNMTQAFIDQTITAVDSLCWVDARSETTYIEHILPNLAVLDDVTDGSDY